MSEDFVSPLPTGSDPESVFHQETHARTRGPASRIRNTTTVWAEYTPRGIFLHAKTPKGGGGTSGGMNYKGTYDNSLAYKQYDVVRVQTGLYQGVWICVVVGQVAGQAPVWPEPATTGGSNIWELIAFGVIPTSVCTGGSGTLLINSNVP